MEQVENDLRIWWGNPSSGPIIHVSEPSTEETEQTEEESSSSEFDPVTDCTENLTTPPYFEVFHEKKTWHEAEEFCVSQGGHLASIHNDAENHQVYSMTGKYIDASDENKHNFYWIGYNDLQIENDYNWSDRTCDAYDNWAAGEPNNSAEGHFNDENCVSYWIGETWNDWNCEHRAGFVCRKNDGFVAPACTPENRDLNTPEGCVREAEERGLYYGDANYQFAGDWSVKGCYTYVDADDPFYGGVWFGTGGTEEQMNTALDRPVRRFEPCGGWDHRGY